MAPWQWDGLEETDFESYRTFGDSDLDVSYGPHFPATFASHVRGVHRDFFDRRRPPNGSLTVGAIEVR
jgi:hypothetical protein